jgi:hypothetical protein
MRHKGRHEFAATLNSDAEREHPTTPVGPIGGREVLLNKSA